MKGPKWPVFTPPATALCRRYSGLVLLRRLHLFLARLSDYEFPIVFVGWTLEYEVLFYLVFAAGLLLKSTKRQVAFPFLFLITLVTTRVSDPIMLEFLFGMVAGVISHRVRKMRFAVFLVVCGVFLLFASLRLGVDIHRSIKWGAPAFLIVIGAFYSPAIRGTIFQILGAASYSIYLVQVFTIPLFYAVAQIIFMDVQRDVLALSCVLASALVGLLVHFGLELPVTRALNAIKRFKFQRL